MKKLRMIMVAVAVVALLSMAVMPVDASPPLPAAGYFDYVPDMEHAIFRQANGNTFFFAISDDLWVGTFAGPGHTEEYVEFFASGSGRVVGRSTIDCTVNGRQGVLVLQLEGRIAAGEPEWQGQWTIVSATGELANLHGRGIWWGPGFDHNPDIYYSGEIHFDPE